MEKVSLRAFQALRTLKTRQRILDVSIFAIGNSLSTNMALPINANMMRYYIVNPSYINRLCCCSLLVVALPRSRLYVYIMHFVQR